MNLIFSDQAYTVFTQPKPNFWTTTVSETIEVLSQNKIDILKVWNQEGAEELGLYLRDNPSNCPLKMEFWPSIDPLVKIKIGMWLGDKTDLTVI